jgi:hypothetical protein
VTRAILALKVQEQQLIASKKQAMAGVSRRPHNPQQLQLYTAAPQRQQQWGRQLQSPRVQTGSLPQGVGLGIPGSLPPSMGQLQQATLQIGAASAASWGSPY